jgi:hypothetical protein
MKHFLGLFYRLAAAGLILLALGFSLAAAQTGGSYDLTWWTIDTGGSGGGMGADKRVTGGSYELLSTVGQPETEVSAISAGDYTLSNGFWSADLKIISGIYLPIIIKGALPDLVGSFTLDPAGPALNAGQPALITAVVTNTGAAATGAFWVDFYINPSTTPTVNRRWNDLCSMSPCYGLAWYVTDLNPGQSVTLTSAPGNYGEAYSNWPGYFASGVSSLYLYVDSWNPGVATGGVAESSETNNLYQYPGGVVVTGLDVTSDAGSPPDIPPRPAP